MLYALEAVGDQEAVGNARFLLSVSFYSPTSFNMSMDSI
jgi:hypothetical protein